MPTTSSRLPRPGEPRPDPAGRSRPSAATIGVAASIALLHVAGWGALAVAAAGPARPGAAAFGLGIGLTAYMLGVRHAFDADHIAAIDNTTRKLMQQGVRGPAPVGFWFSCGHSTVVFALTLLLAFGVGAVAASLVDDGSPLHAFTGLVGPLVSSSFLLAIAALNVPTLVALAATLRAARAGRLDEAALERRLDGRGMLNRLAGRVAGVVTRPRHMYVVGLLFGLGFDTATEVGLLALATSGSASGLPWYAVLCLPVLFAAGMSLFDTLQGSLMSAAYGWALARPVRRVCYNLVVTGVSVAVAVAVAAVEIAGLVAERLHLEGALWRGAAGLDLDVVGIAVACLFVAVWGAAAALSRSGRAAARLDDAGDRA